MTVDLWNKLVDKWVERGTAFGGAGQHEVMVDFESESIYFSFGTGAYSGSIRESARNR